MPNHNAIGSFEFSEQISSFLDKAVGFVWGPPLIILLFGTHLFLTVRLGFVQRHILRAIRFSIRRESGAGDVSHFGSLATALAATVGTGNIIGVASAITVGGPGAVLWMWLTGVFGIATKYAEAVLSVKYRVQTPWGQMAGGPMYVLERALGMKWAAVLFALVTALAAFGIGNMAQSNTVVAQIQQMFPALTTNKKFLVAVGLGVLMAVLTGMVILGGIRSIARACTWLVPFMAGFYVLGCLLILIKNAAALPDTLRIIFDSAFCGHAAVGGFSGAVLKDVIQQGIARGLFSNESGLGSTPIVAAAAKTSSPVRQGLVASTGTFWDTVVICALTGLVLVSSGHWREGLPKAALTQSAFGDLIYFGPTILTVALVTFVFSTILGWSYYGEKAIEYLFGQKSIFPYRLLWIGAVFIGAIAPLNDVWNFCDIMNGLMAIPNLFSLLLLSNMVARETKDFFTRQPNS